MAALVGVSLGPYELIEAIGAGGMGEVYRAHDARLDREVAVKVLPPGLAAEPEALERFQREARAVAALSHPNILALHDFGDADGHAYAVTELLHGETLRERLRRGPLALREALDVALQMADGLATAHERGIVHRDLKPENVFLQRDGRVKLLDFGLARFVRALAQDAGPAAAARVVASEAPPAPSEGLEPTPSLNESSSGLVIGSIGYMSPEQALGEPADARSDIFCFGVVLYEMIAGRRAFRGGREGGSARAVLSERPPSLTGVRPEVPMDLDRIVMHCLEAAAQDRFQSMRDLAFDLTTVLAHQDFDRRAETRDAAPVATVTLSDDGRIALPAVAREALGLAPGSRLDVTIRRDRVELRLAREREAEPSE